MKTGIELIAEERKEQIEKHGRTVEKDASENVYLQLSEAASVLALDYPHMCLEQDDVETDHCPHGWNSDIWIKMVRKPYKERLIIAGALIAAEIDRLNYNVEQEDKANGVKP